MNVLSLSKGKKNKGFVIKKVDSKGIEDDVFVRVYNPESRKVAYTKYLVEAKVYATEDQAQGVIDDIMRIECSDGSDLKLFGYDEVRQ